MTDTPIEIARKDGRDYITPEDVQASINSGCNRDVLWREVLRVIGKQEGMGCEDVGLTAFVATKFEKDAP